MSGSVIAFFALAVVGIVSSLLVIYLNKVVQMVVAIVFTFLSIAGIYILGLKFLPNKKPEDPFMKELKSIELKLDSIISVKDSIRTIIVTVDKEIINNEKHYEEVVNNIITQPSYMDSLYVSEYIERYIDATAEFKPLTELLSKN